IHQGRGGKELLCFAEERTGHSPAAQTVRSLSDAEAGLVGVARTRMMGTQPLCPPEVVSPSLRGAQRVAMTTASAGRHHIGINPAARDRRFADAVAVIAGDHDRIS